MSSDNPGCLEGIAFLLFFVFQILKFVFSVVILLLVLGLLVSMCGCTRRSPDEQLKLCDIQAKAALERCKDDRWTQTQEEALNAGCAVKALATHLECREKIR